MSDLPPRWEWSTTRELFTFVTSGSRGWARYYADEGAPFIRIGNLQRDSIKLDLTELQRVNPPKGGEGSRTKVQPNDILISITADLGRIALMSEVKEDSYINQHIALARPTEEVNAKYLAWYLSSSAVQRQWIKQQRGATKLGLGLDDIRSIAVPIPPRPEQNRIVDAIEEQISRLDAGSSSLLRSKRGLDRVRNSSLQALIFESATDCRRIALGELIASGPQNGLYLPANRYGRGLPILRITDFQNGWVRSRKELRLAEPQSGHGDAFTISAGDLIINRVNSMSHLGKSLAVGTDLEGVLFESNMMRLRLNKEAVPEFVSLYLQSPQGRSRLLKNAKQAINQASINQTDVRATLIALPSIKSQKEIIARYNFVSGTVAQITSAADRATRRAELLRTSILSAAFSGKLT